MTILYATVDDLLPHINEAPDVNLDRLVRFASGIIQRATRRARYDTTPLGLPQDETLMTAMREATVAQIRAWVEADLWEQVATAGVKVGTVLKSSSINGKSITLDTSASDAARAHLLAGGLSLEAELILDNAGLLSGLPGVYR